MSENARERILDRLRSAPRPEEPRPEEPAFPAATAQLSERIARLKSLMEAMRTEVHVVAEALWPACLREILSGRSVKTLLYGPGSAIAATLEAAAAAEGDPGFAELKPYDAPVESLKDPIFKVDAAVTTAAGAVADTGALILVPDAAEPRLMSVVPPIHIAVLRAETIFDSLGAAMQARRWADAMPTNLLLISGPSKTADIELTLAFGVHGPKELIVLVVE
jgi:L-lactate dehydrogenase complex protein LldG